MAPSSFAIWCPNGFAFALVVALFIFAIALVFAILVSSYIKDGLDLHSDSTSKLSILSVKPTAFNPNLTKFSCRKSFYRFYSTAPLVAVKIYENADKDKLKILKENKGKAGVYRWVNIENGRSYIGSSVNLTRRFQDYFSPKHLIKNKMVIYKALIKHGYSKFNLEILEYSMASEAILREQYYIDHLNPEYNILRRAGSSLGFKHSMKTIVNMKNRV
jgi:hypothetical protein